jgi:tRNA (cytidine/uridine-2'-O-)-methyltransferase
VFDIVLYEPEIPPNTGNALRLAANAGARLHLVRPLGFTLSDKQLLRAGLDYSDLEALRVHDDWAACAAALRSRRLFAVSTRGARSYAEPQYRADDVFVFGPETRGLPQDVLESFPQEQRIRIPMRDGNRSLNLSNAIAIVIYEAWRQNGFG